MQNNLAQFLAKRAELNPRLEALVDIATGQRFTYAELNS
jgi:acyl-CoA synthetase (AMP-forming)/AMP-acid ligase II